MLSAAVRFSLGHLTLATVLALAIVVGLSRPASATFILGSAANYGLLYEGNGGNILSFNNSNETGNIGIGNTGGFQGNGPGSITGLIDFSAANTGQFSNSGVTLTPSANNPMYNVSDVTTALNTANSLSQTLGLEAGTSTTISSGGTVNASSGTLDGNGNRVFTVTSISFPNGTFTVNGTASDYVVFNIADGVGTNGLNGSITLTGGITSDQVLFNYTPSTSNLTTYNNDYTNLTGGPTMTISTNGAATTGVFLDPTGNFQVNNTHITGRVIGGDTQNSSFVSGANLVVPESNTATLTALGLLCLAARRRAESHRSHRAHPRRRTWRRRSGPSTDPTTGF